MRYTILIIASLFSLYSCSQDIPASKVPSVVLNTVQARFGSVDKIEWEKKAKVYEAEFKMDSVEYSVYVDAAGKLILYKMEIRVNELPQAVSASILNKYGGYKIDEVEKIEKDGVAYYEVELDGNGKKDLELIFSADGELVTGMDYLG